MDNEEVIRLFADFIDSNDYRCSTWFAGQAGADFKQYMKSDFIRYVQDRAILKSNGETRKHKTEETS